MYIQLQIINITAHIDTKRVGNKNDINRNKVNVTDPETKPRGTSRVSTNQANCCMTSKVDDLNPTAKNDCIQRSGVPPMLKE